jgi:hypothetical protein
MVFQIPEDNDSSCYAKARRRGQKTFTVVEQDATAVQTIAHWIYLNINTAPGDKLRAALEDCIAWRDFRNKKTAD